MTNSYINPTQPTASEPRYSQNEPAWQDVEIVGVPAVEARSSACPPWRNRTRPRALLSRSAS